MKLRNSIVWAHKWLALLAGAFWGLTAVTGGILVYEPEIERLLNGGRFEVSSDTLPPGGLDRALEENFPGEWVGSLAWLREDNVIRLTVRNDSSARQAFIDAGTGAVITNMRPRREYMRLVGAVHTSLLVPRHGHWLVTAASAAAVLSMLTGLYLWWPGIRTFLTGFRVRLRRGLYILNFDLHQMLGAVTVVILFIMTGTGVLMGIPGANPGLARLLLPEDPPAVAAPATPATEAAGPPPSVEALVAMAEKALNGRVVSLTFTGNPPEDVDVRVRPDGERGPVTRLILARADGRIVRRFDRSTWTREARFGATVTRWHTANFVSEPARAVFAAACFLGLLIAMSGLVIWWLKRTRRLESARQRAAPA